MYDNIQKALNTQKVPQGSRLSNEVQLRNQDLFSRLMKEGVDLQDLIDRANAPKEPPVDPVVFSVMEEAVKSDVEAEAKRRKDIGTRVLAKMMMTDPEQAKADKEYHDAVIKAYMMKKEETRGENTQDPLAVGNGLLKPPSE